MQYGGWPVITSAALLTVLPLVAETLLLRGPSFYLDTVPLVDYRGGIPSVARAAGGNR